MRVLFICRANAGRSQIAEAFYNALTGSADATSAGIDLAHSILKDDLSVPPLVLETMKEAGIDISSARRKPVTEELLNESDKAILLMEDNEFPLPSFLENSPKVIRWNDIPDAKGTSAEFHAQVRDQIKEKVEKLIS